MFEPCHHLFNRIAIGTLAILFVANAASAIGFDWTDAPMNVYSGDWSDGAHWNGAAGFPDDQTDSANISNSGVGPFTVTLDLNVRVGSFFLNAPDALFTATNRVFRVDGSNNFGQGVVNWTNSQILDAQILGSAPGTFTQSTTLNVRGSSIIDVGTFNQNGNLNVNADPFYNTTLTVFNGFTNRGLIDIDTSSTTSTALVVQSGTLNNGGGTHPAATLLISGSGSGQRLFRGNLENNAIVSVTDPVTFNGVGDTFTNNSTFDIDPGVGVTANGGSQTFNQNAGNLNVDGSFTATNINFNFNGGTITGNTITMTDSALNIAPGSGTGSFLMRGEGGTYSGTLKPGQSLNIRSDSTANTTVTSSTGFTNQSNLTVRSISTTRSLLRLATGALTNDASGAIDFTGSGSREFQGDLINNGTVNVNAYTRFNRAGDTFTNNSAFNVASGVTLEMIAGSQTFNQNGGTLDVQGAFDPTSITFNFNGGDHTGNSIVMTNSTLNIAPSAGNASFVMRGEGGVFSGDLAAGQFLEARSDGLTNTTVSSADGFVNESTLTVRSNSTTRSLLRLTTGALTNEATGVLNFTGSGSREFQGDLVNNGTVNVNAYTRFNRANDVFTNNSAFNVASTVTLEMIAGSQTFNQNAGALDVQGAFNPTNITFNFNGGDVTGNAMTMTNSTLNIAPTAGNGSFIMRGEGGTFSGDLAAGQFLTVRSDSSTNTTVTSADSFVNESTLTVRSNSTTRSLLRLTTGALTNDATGVLNFTGSGSREFQGDLVNNGTVNVNAYTRFNRSGDTFTNNNLFNIAPSMTLEMIAGSQTFNQNAGALDVQGAFNPTNITFNFNGGDVTGNAMTMTNSTLNIAPTAGNGSFIMRGEGGTFSGDLAAGQFLTVRSDSSTNTTVTSADSFVNESTLTVRSNSTTRSLLRLTTGALTNDATGVLNFTGSGSREFQSDLVNNGTVNVNAYTRFNRANDVFTNNSAFNVASTVTLEMIAGSQTFNQDSGTLDNQGAFNPSAITFNFNGGDVTGNRIDMTNSTLNIAPASGVGAFLLRSNGSLNGDINAGQTVVVNADSATNTTVTTPGGFTNEGDLRVNTSTSTSSRLLLSGGTLINEASGVTAFSGAGGGFRELRGGLDNRGVVSVLMNATIGEAGKDHLNSGSFIVNATATMVGNSFTNQATGRVGGNGNFNVSGMTFDNAGTIGPGESVGELTITGVANFAPTGQLEAELNGPGTPGADHDRLVVTGAANIDGTVDLQVLGTYTPVLGDTMQVLNAASVNGTFSQANGVVQTNPLGLAVRYGPGHVNVRVSIRGDVDFDDDVDTGDITTAIINYTGAGGSGKLWIDGDFDGDGDTDTGDLTTAIINFTGASAANPNVPDLVYDPATGNVTIDADGSDVISFSLQSGPFNAADFSELPAGLTDNIASQIGWTSFNLFSGLTGSADLGAILPAGLDLAGLEAALSTASYGLALSGGGGGGRLDIIIPEPGTVVLIGLGGLALVCRRRAAWGMRWGARGKDFLDATESRRFVA